jgi:four helix bundle protein
MSEVRSYRDLLIWQKGVQLVKRIYKLTRKFPAEERFGLANQMQRSATSIPSNIAEGQARQHTNEFRQFLFVALGSVAEVDTQIMIALELGYITEENANELNITIIELQKMIHILIKRLPR